MSSVLVTGGTGFLGRRLVERLLAQGRSVTFLARHPLAELERRGARFICASLDDPDDIRNVCKNVETVFHVGAKVGVWGRYNDYFITNVLGTRTLLEGCRAHGVKNFVYTSTPSVIYNGFDLADADENYPLTEKCPSPYPLTKAIAEREVLKANSEALRTVALRPHLIWGVGDPHLVPRVLERARAGRLRVVGSGKNRVDMVHVENVVDAQLLAEKALDGCAPGKAYFITNDEPTLLWAWINQLLSAVNERPADKYISLRAAKAVGAVCETLWRVFPMKGEPPMTRFVAAELAKDHWFNITAAKRDLGYRPRISMAEGTIELIAHLKKQAGLAQAAHSPAPFPPTNRTA